MRIENTMWVRIVGLSGAALRSVEAAERAHEARIAAAQATADLLIAALSVPYESATAADIASALEAQAAHSAARQAIDAYGIPDRYRGQYCTRDNLAQWPLTANMGACCAESAATRAAEERHASLVAAGVSMPKDFDVASVEAWRDAAARGC
jgi:hypothetical protein